MGSEHDSVPYYGQVASILRVRITGAAGAESIELESERDLCNLYGVSRITIRKALDLLEAEGLIKRSHGCRTRSVPGAVEWYKRSRQNRVIHVVTGWLPLAGRETTFYGQIYQGILSSIEKAGYMSSLQRIPGRRGEPPWAALRPTHGTNTLGIILLGIMDDRLVEMFVETGHPVVCVDHWTNVTRADSLVVDCFGEGMTVGEYLLRQGHEDLFYVGNVVGRGHKEADSELLLAGLQRAIGLANGPAIPAGRIFHCPAGPPLDVRPSVEWFLSLRPRPTAGVIFQMDVFHAFVSALREQEGIRLAEDLSVVARTFTSQQTWATCVESDAFTLGRLAVQCVLDRAEGRRTNARADGATEPVTARQECASSCRLRLQAGWPGQTHVRSLGVPEESAEGHPANHQSERRNTSLYTEDNSRRGVGGSSIRL